MRFRNELNYPDRDMKYESMQWLISDVSRIHSYNFDGLITQNFGENLSVQVVDVDHTTREQTLILVLKKKISSSGAIINIYHALHEHRKILTHQMPIFLIQYCGYTGVIKYWIRALIHTFDSPLHQLSGPYRAGPSWENV